MPKTRIPFRVKPMLATLVDAPFHRPGWTYEEKYDGHRILAYKEGQRVTLFSRNAKDHTSRYPRIAAAIAKLSSATLLLDGEVVVFDAKHISRFQLLSLGKGEPVYAVFDCLYRNGKDLRRESLSVRQEVLKSAVTPSKLVFIARRLSANGMDAFKQAKRMGFEGLVAKDRSSKYAERRSTSWLKVKVHEEDEFVIGGFTRPGGQRMHFGALLLGAYDKGKLRFVGKVGTGFDEKTLAFLAGKFRPLIRADSPFADPLRERDVIYLVPKLVAQISYQEWTQDLKLRQPVFLGLRDDKKAKGVQLPRAL